MIDLETFIQETLIVAAAIFVIGIVMSFLGCTTKATIQEEKACQKACGYQLKAACATMLWTICDCSDGKRIRISE